MTEQQQPLAGAHPNVPRTVLQAEQARLLYAGIPVSLAVNALIASILVATQRSVLNTESIMVWCTLLGATLVLRAVFAVNYGHAQLGALAHETWLTRFRIGTAATGIAWGLTSFLLFAGSDIPHQSFLAFAIAGMTAGAVTSLSIDLVSSLAFIIPALVPLIVRLLAESGEIPVAMGAMVTLYLVALILIARRTYISIRENICLRFEAVTREQDLRESEAQLIKAQEVAQTGSWNLDIPRNSLIWSLQVYRIFGISPGTPLTFAVFIGCVHPDDSGKVGAAWDAALRGVPYDIEHRIVVEGQVRWVRGRAQIEFDPEFQPLTGIGTVQDITERKRAAELLCKSAEEIEDLYNQAPCGYHSLDKDGIIRRINDTELAWLGYTRDEVVGRMKWSDLITSASLQTFRENFPRFMRDGFVRDLEYGIIRADGTIFIGLLNATAIYDPSGNFVMSRSTVVDITERKRAELQARELSAHLQVVREEEKASCAREIHDDLGSTLAALKMDAYWLVCKLEEEKEMEPLLECAQSMVGLLDVAVLATRRIISDLRPTILDDVGLAAALKWNSAQFQKRTGIECRVDCDEDEGCEDGLDKTQLINLFRIFQETLTNVARHSGASRVEVVFRQNVEEVALSISDNGCGLPDGHTVAPTSYGIRGMRERVEQLGGKIKFDSQPGSGFSVTVKLPLSAAPQKEANE